MPELTVASAVLLVCAALGAISDARVRRLPNWLCLITALAGLGFALAGGGWAALGNHAAHMAAALLVGMVLFRFAIVGGGDAKFYAACAAWFALDDGLRLLMHVALSGLVLILLWFVWRRITRKAISRPGGDDAGKFPYGTAIAAGAVLLQILT